MTRKEPTSWDFFRLYLWLEVKKWTRIRFAGSTEGLLLVFVLLLLSLTSLNLSLYRPIWHEDPRGTIIGGLFIILLGFFLLSLLNSIVPMDGTGVILPGNPFHFNPADLSVVSLSSGSPFTWALIGLFRTTIKSLWFSFLFFGLTFAYCVEYGLPLIRVFLVVGVLFVAFHTVTLSGAFSYTVVEEIVEKIKPRWREKNLSSIETMFPILILIIFFGGMWFLMEAGGKIGSISLELLVLDYWFVPPFNIIYVTLGFLSKSWPQTMLVPALFTIFIQFFIIIIGFCLIIGKIDPLARLYERQALMDLFTAGDSRPISFPFVTRITQYYKNFIDTSKSTSQMVIEMKSLFYKDVLLSWKYKQSFGYAISLIISYGVFFTWLRGVGTIYLPIFIPVMFWGYLFTFFLWRMESKSILWNNYHLSKTALLAEKFLLSFLLMISLQIPLYLVQGEFLFAVIGIGLYFLSFTLGIINFLLQN